MDAQTEIAESQVDSSVKPAQQPKKPRGKHVTPSTQFYKQLDGLQSQVNTNWKSTTFTQLLSSVPPFKPALALRPKVPSPIDLTKTLKNLQAPKRLDYFEETFKLSAQQRENIDQIVSHFTSILESSELSFLNPKLSLTGPIAANLGLATSTIDLVLSVDVPANYNLPEFDTKTVNLLVQLIESILKRGLGVPPTEKQPFSLSNICRRLSSDKTALYREVNIFVTQNIAQIEEQAALIRQLAESEPRIHQLLFLLLNWAKQNRLIDSPKAAFTCNTFSLLVIFFLQNTSPPILRPINQITNNGNSSQSKKSPKKEANRQSVPQLAREFFTFYLYFNFTQFAVSPRLGASDLLSKSDLPKKTLSGKAAASTIFIEDPFTAHKPAAVKLPKNDFKWQFLLLKFSQFTQLNQGNYLVHLTSSGVFIVRERFAKVTNQLIGDLKANKVSSYPNDDSIYLYLVVDNYFQALTEFLTAPGDADYRKVTLESFDDLAFYGDRLKSFLSNSNVWNNETTDKYLQLIEDYQKLHPAIILQIREQVLNANVGEKVRRVHDNPGNEFKMDFDVVGYFPIDPKQIHELLIQIEGSQGQLDFLISEIALSSETAHKRSQFLKHLNSVLEKCSYLSASLQPHAFSFGSLANGLGFADSDLDIFIQLGANSGNTILDYETSVALLNRVRELMKNSHSLGFSRSAFNGRWFIPSRRCPIIKLSFAACYQELAKEVKAKCQTDLKWKSFTFNQVDISVSSSFGLYNSRFLKFLTQLEPRFYQLAMFLKYWSKQNGLVNTEIFSSYALTMMILFFLQNTDPWILPSVERLQQLAIEKQPEKLPTIVDAYNFTFCDDTTLIERSANTQTVPELIVQFFNFYRAFDYQTNAICPRIGRILSKEELRKIKMEAKLETHFRPSYLTIEDPFLLEHNCGAIFQQQNKSKWKRIVCKVLDELAITPENVVQLLSDPKNFATSGSKGRGFTDRQERRAKKDAKYKKKRFARKNGK